MTKKQVLNYYIDYKTRLPQKGEENMDNRMFLAGMKHILVLQAIIKGNTD